jgi:hypothetical protein
MLYPIRICKRIGFCNSFKNFFKKSKNWLLGKSRIKNRKNKKIRKFFFILCVKWADSYFEQKKISKGRDENMAKIRTYKAQNLKFNRFLFGFRLRFDLNS